MPSLIPALAIAQAAACGLYGTPATPGGCSLPAPGGGSYLLQESFGQLYIQESPGFSSHEQHPAAPGSPYTPIELQPITRPQ